MLAGGRAAAEGNAVASDAGTAAGRSSAAAVGAECVQEHPDIYKIPLQRNNSDASDPSTFTTPPLLQGPPPHPPLFLWSLDLSLNTKL